MGTHHRLLQELEWILQRRFGLLLKTFDKKPRCDLRGNFATRVAAHAVGDEQQQRVAAIGIRDPVLIDLARTLAGFLENRRCPSCCRGTGSN